MKNIQKSFQKSGEFSKNFWYFLIRKIYQESRQKSFSPSGFFFEISENRPETILFFNSFLQSFIQVFHNSSQKFLKTLDHWFSQGWIKNYTESNQKFIKCFPQLWHFFC